MAVSALISGYLALGSALSSANVLTELSGNGYARQAVACTYDPVTGTIYISAATFGPDVTANWLAAAFVALFDAGTGGNLIFSFGITGVSVLVGQSFTVPAASVQLSGIGRGLFVAGGVIPPGTALGTVTDQLAPSLSGGTATTGPTALALSAALVLSAQTLVFISPYVASLTIDWANGTNQNITLTGNVTAYNVPLNGLPGTRYRMTFIQDGTGGRTLGGINAIFKHVGGPLTLSTAPNAIDVVEYYYDGTTYWGDVVSKSMG